ncbi:rhamnogalacturonan acetylesterase [Enterococcus timonensis]|uniref:rhamnogalacturonan acetylesterase n=1 Tax=Enterococcus timonensis TaxID=1852364 RepID=UPI0008DAA63F|nr:rhamnogalacturonan acetylesterase [Enterococcus timonensis]
MKIFIAGDSTAANKAENKRPEAGWGEYLQDFFVPEVLVVNYAKNGRSTKSFITDGYLIQLAKEMVPGDFSFLQFGHNDQKLESPERGTLPFSTYQENLQQMIDVCRAHQVTPIMLTSVTRRQYLNGQIDPTLLGDYPAAAMETAKKNNLVCLDLHQATIDFLNQFDDATSRQFFLQLQPGQHPNYPDGVMDNTHSNEKGAQQNAALVIEELKKSAGELKNFLK